MARLVTAGPALTAVAMAGSATLRAAPWRLKTSVPGGDLQPAAGNALRENALPSPARARDGGERRQDLGSAITAEDADAALIRRLQAGDERALEALMLAHGGRLRLIARRICGRADEADDVVQDAFLVLWRQAAKLDPGRGPIGAYLTRVVVNRSIDRARRARLLRFIGLDTAPDPADDAPGPETVTLARSEVSAVMRDLAALPPRQRAAILLASGDDPSTAAIADVMNLSVGATEQLLVRARRTLRLRAMERQTMERQNEERAGER